jgi:hypothetical protein
MPWWAYLVASPLILAGGIAFYFSDQQAESAKLIARHHAPPAAFAIEKFDPARDVGRANEVVVVGQVDLAKAMELTETKNGAEIHHWTVAAMYPADAADTSAPAIGAMVHDGVLSDQQLASFVVGRGPFGPIMKIDGVQTTEFSAQEAVRKTVSGKVTMAPSALLVDPFENGRKAGLAPSDSGKIAAGVIVGLALLSLAYGFFRRWQKRSSEDPYI